MTKMRVLFVDDEPEILNGLRRMLRKHRNDWETAFATSGEEALTRMRELPFQVIVSDMRMPGMDGAELLAKVAREFPETYRIVLSGQAQETALIRAAECTHEFLNKPCDPEVLVDAISKVATAGCDIEDDGLRQLINQVVSLPSLPSIYQELCACVEKESFEIDDAAAIVAEDLAVSAKVLHLVNSSFCGLSSHVGCIKKAVRLIGVSMLKSIAMSAGLFRDLSPSLVPKTFSMESLWNHSFRVGVLSKQIAKEITGSTETAERAFTAGILHDIGILVLISEMSDTVSLILDDVREQRIPFWQAEYQRLQTTHAHIGAYLLQLWKLPAEVVEAVRHHHTPAVSETGRPAIETVAVYVANEFAHTEEAGESGYWDIPVLDRGFLEAAGVVDEVPKWRNRFQTTIDDQTR